MLGENISANPVHPLTPVSSGAADRRFADQTFAGSYQQTGSP
jgi:hypothetical protein